MPHGLESVRDPAGQDKTSFERCMSARCQAAMSGCETRISREDCMNTR